MMPIFNSLHSPKFAVFALLIFSTSCATAETPDASRFTNCRVEGTRLGAERAQRADAIASAWQHSSQNNDKRQLAYVLATAYRESGNDETHPRGQGLP